MSFLNSILNKVKEERNLSDATLKLFKQNLRILSEGKEIENLDFLKNVDRIKEILSYYKQGTQNNILQTINRVLEQTNETNLLETYRKLYYEVYTNIKKKPTDEKTDAQEQNWIDWKDVEETAKVYYNTAFETRDWNDILNALVLGLYVFFEPRRNQDYLRMYIVRRKLDSTLKAELDAITDKNFLILKPKKQFIFNTYKTAKSFGRQTFEIENEGLNKLIDLYWDEYPAKKEKFAPLLVNKEGKPLTSVNAITRILNNIFGVSIGASMLRHIYLTSKYGDSYKDREITSEKMSHSIGTQHKYVKKSS